LSLTEDEVRSVIANLPNDKAPGPDGFTGLFYKKAWGTIKMDVMNAFNAFWLLDFRSFNHLNDAYMILLKKKEHPAEIRDYRPISLIHSFSKLITKCLANRLAGVLDALVLRNQSAFIRGRRIHDNFRNVQIACKAIHEKKSPTALLKIDIAKAFDTVSWPFLLEVLQHMGFGQRWRDWISIILATASTKILLNGRPGRRICHARGLRQGDPFSPMLFVLTMEVIKAVLTIFGLASGLFSNLDKSVASPLHCSENDIARVRDILSCRIEDLPCRYLGAPLSVRRLKRSDEQPLIDKVAAKIPIWKGNMLNVAGRTALVKAATSAIPTHMSIVLCLSPWAIESIDRLRRAFIWCGSDKVTGGKCKVAWETVCRPRDLGSLGVSDLRRAGIALRVRWEWQARVERRPALASKEQAVVGVFQAATVFMLGMESPLSSGQTDGLTAAALRMLLRLFSPR
jgi:hypothetical protein